MYFLNLGVKGLTFYLVQDQAFPSSNNKNGAEVCVSRISRKAHEISENSVVEGRGKE